jgi:hypothetical protein
MRHAKPPSLMRSKRGTGHTSTTRQHCAATLRTRVEARQGEDLERQEDRSRGRVRPGETEPDSRASWTEDAVKLVVKAFRKSPKW